MCTSNPSVTVSTVTGAMNVVGVFPHDISWAPPGAWLRATLRLHDGTTSVRYTDVRFPGQSLNCRASGVFTRQKQGSCYDQLWLKPQRIAAKLKWSETYDWYYDSQRSGGLP